VRCEGKRKTIVELCTLQIHYLNEGVVCVFMCERENKKNEKTKKIVYFLVGMKSLNVIIMRKSIRTNV
jgi:hypothetical protein